jgi:hypothetical protein
VVVAVTPGTAEAMAVAELSRPGGRHDQIGADRLVRAAGGRPGHRGAEHRHRGDQGQADHESGGGLGGTPGTAHRVLPPELARFPEEAGQRAADHAGQRAGNGRGQGGGAEEDGDRTDADERDGPLSQPDGQQDHPDQGQGRAPDEPAAERGDGAGPAVIQRGDRRDTNGATGRAEGGHDRYADADQQPDDRGARLEHQRSGRQRDPEPA